MSGAGGIGVGDGEGRERVLTLTQADFAGFARLSGDANPIHLDPDFAAASRFGRPVAHGMLLVTILQELAADLIPAGWWLTHQVRFPHPAFAGEPLRFRVALAACAAGRVELGLEVRRLADDGVTCDGQFIAHAAPPHPAGTAMDASPMAEPGDSAILSRIFTAGDLKSLAALAGTGEAGPGTEAGLGVCLVAALFSRLLGMDLPGPGTNYLKQQTEFLVPLPLDGPVTARVTVTRIRPDKALVDLDCQCHAADGALIARGRALVAVRDVAGWAGRVGP